MGKSRTDRNGLTREQRLVKENQALKRKINQLNKLLARIDLDRYEQVREIIEEHYAEDKKQEAQEMLDKMKQEWKCLGCQNGYMEIIIFTKMGEPWYYRTCNEKCGNRTKTQKYECDKVKGIFKNNSYGKN